MAEHVAGRVLLAVEVGRHCATQVADADLKGHAGAALLATGQVIRQPCNDARKRRVDGAGAHEDTAVDDA